MRRKTWMPLRGRHLQQRPWAQQHLQQKEARQSQRSRTQVLLVLALYLRLIHLPL